MRVQWFASIVHHLADGSFVDKQVAVRRLVTDWYSTTRDNYLASLAKFAAFCTTRCSPAVTPFVFAPAVQLAFVDLLLSSGPAGRG